MIVMLLALLFHINGRAGILSLGRGKGLPTRSDLPLEQFSARWGTRAVVDGRATKSRLSFPFEQWSCTML
jgi:hypothetical protein